MFIMQAPMNVEAPECWEMGDTALEHLKNVLRDCQAAGRFKGQDIEFLSFYVWSSMHGMCALYCRDRCQAYPDMDADLLMTRGFEIFVQNLEKL
jgi:hypothetical protein